MSIPQTSIQKPSYALEMVRFYDLKFKNGKFEVRNLDLEKGAKSILGTVPTPSHTHTYHILIKSLAQLGNNGVLNSSSDTLFEIVILHVNILKFVFALSSCQTTPRFHYVGMELFKFPERREIANKS